MVERDVPVARHRDTFLFSLLFQPEIVKKIKILLSFSVALCSHVPCLSRRLRDDLKFRDCGTGGEK